MGTFITVVLALLIFGVGLTVFYRSIRKELVTGQCAGCSGCSSDKKCCSTPFIQLDLKDSKK